MNAKKILSRHYNENTKHLFKQFLRIVEELKRDHDDAHKKMRENLPEQYSSILNMGDYLDDDKMSYIRKKILDLGNETMRSSDSELNNFTVSFIFKD
jgi:uncharacterized protein YeeX (DUF496 family)